jgi:sulfur carrier protein
LKILLNGEAFATDAKTLDELCARLGFAEAKIATAVNGNFVAAVQRSTTTLAPTDEIEIVAPRQGG